MSRKSVPYSLILIKITNIVDRVSFRSIQTFLLKMKVLDYDCLRSWGDNHAILLLIPFNTADEKERRDWEEMVSHALEAGNL